MPDDKDKVAGPEKNPDATVTPDDMDNVASLPLSPRQVVDTLFGNQQVLAEVLELVLDRFGERFRSLRLELDDRELTLEPARTQPLIVMSESMITTIGEKRYLSPAQIIGACASRSAAALADNTEDLSAQRIRSFKKKPAYDITSVGEDMHRLLLDPTYADERSPDDIRKIWKHYNSTAQGLSHHTIMEAMLNHPDTPPEVLDEMCDRIQCFVEILSRDTELRKFPVQIFYHPHATSTTKKRILLEEWASIGDWYNTFKYAKEDAATVGSEQLDITGADITTMLTSMDKYHYEVRLRLVSRSPLALKDDIFDALFACDNHSIIEGIATNEALPKVKRMQAVRKLYEADCSSRFMGPDKAKDELRMRAQDMFSDLADEIGLLLAE
ncbi:hypothetical protein KBD59_01425 [Candidatus Gracilibacteria bacterium]|nr:hypothetical protein [Candidatus Gracilibacteria bacterium]